MNLASGISDTRHSRTPIFLFFFFSLSLSLSPFVSRFLEFLDSLMTLWLLLGTLFDREGSGFWNESRPRVKRTCNLSFIVSPSYSSSTMKRKAIFFGLLVIHAYRRTCKDRKRGIEGIEKERERERESGEARQVTVSMGLEDVHLFSWLHRGWYTLVKVTSAN